MSTFEDLAEAVSCWEAAELEVASAVENRVAAHRTHVDTIPLVGRLHVGSGSDRTRKAHHAACQEVVRVQIIRDRLARAVVVAAAAHVAESAPGATATGPGAAQSVSESNPGPLEVEG